MFFYGGVAQLTCLRTHAHSFLASAAALPVVLQDQERRFETHPIQGLLARPNAAQGRAEIAKAFNDAIKQGEIGPVVLGRDHHDVSGTDSPFRETSNIYDGSRFTADMAIHNVIGDSFRGATWVSIHNGGGVGWGEVTNGGFGMLLDGYDAAERRLKSMLLFDVNNGIGDVYAKIQRLPEAKKAEIEADLAAVYETRPDMAMVDSDKGITNLHVPSDVIIDASMPAALRASGQMWGPDGKQKDTKFMIPDRNYAGVFSAVVDFCRENGAFDPTTMGTVPNVGLMKTMVTYCRTKGLLI